MLTVRLALQIALLATVIVSGLLIGLSQENLGLSMIGVIGSLSGFIICDWRKWFSLRGGLANVASIAVLLLAMQGFVEGDGATKLICVSNLLVYLQVVLMFQQKNTRRNWQIMVLSLLQVVVAAIFNLNFEGGLLFILFFALAGMTMIFQSFHTANSEIIARNREAARALGALSGSAAANGQVTDEVSTSMIDRLVSGMFGGTESSQSGKGNPITIFDAEPHQERTLPLVMRHLTFWLAACLAFAFLMFFFIPRNSEAWFGPLMVPTQPTGMSMKVDLNQRGKIEQTGERIFRVSFENSLTGEKVQLAAPPYFRGTALGQLRIVDGRTEWTSPYDRVYPSVYRRPPELRPNSRRLIQRFQMNPTDDPMIFSAMPAFSTSDTPQEIEFCYEISALTRRQENDRIEKTPYRYELMTRVGPNNKPLDAWPYSSLGYVRGESLDRSPGDIEWLTYMEPERYPSLVGAAAELAKGFSDDERYEMCRRMETYFQLSQDFSYTLDFTDVEWNEGVDPVEDFFLNHKCGHCELYASALVLMLRSRGIPARLVVGYYSGVYEEENEYYVVRSDDAHAWVEAYLRPSDCTDEMRREGSAGPGGAWLRLDPTPATELANRSSRENAIEIARNLWQEYVMGLDNQQGLTSRSGSMLGLTDLSAWTSGFESAAGEINNRPVLRVGLLVAALLSVMFGVMRTVFGAFGGRKTSERKRRIKMIRNFVGNALGYISPGLKKWMIGEDPDQISTVFYKRLTTVLEEAGHRREPAQTHREFAGQVSEYYSTHSDSKQIRETVDELTDLFYSVRFGNAELHDEEREKVDSSIATLEASIAATQA